MGGDSKDDWKTLPLAMRLSEEELTLLRWIGTRMSRLLLGRHEDLPYIERADELGLVANMVARVVGELRATRKRDDAQREELKARVSELEQARAEQHKLLETVRELSSPTIVVARGVLLVPMAGALDREMLADAELRILVNVVKDRAHTVILDITGAQAIQSETAVSLVQVARAVSLVGAQVILCGVSAQAARTAAAQQLDFAPAILCANLSKAVETALARGARR